MTTLLQLGVYKINNNNNNNNNNNHWVKEVDWIDSKFEKLSLDKSDWNTTHSFD